MPPFRQALRFSTALTFIALTAAPVLAQTAPSYAGASATQCIPFANFQPVSFTDAPRLNISVAGGAINAVQMDTGSVGVAMSYDQLPGYAKLKAQPGAKPGTQFLSSSKELWSGTWVPTTVTLYDRGGLPVATASVPVLGVENAGKCASYEKDQTVCAGMPSAAGSGILYMGVGFGQEADFQPQGTPDKNVLLNLTSIAGQPVAANSLNKGYVIGRQGIQVGLTAANTQDFRFAKLTPYAAYPGDWMPPAGCIAVWDPNMPTSGAPVCTPATVLVDTGIAQSYMTLPTAIPFSTQQRPNPSEAGKMIGAVADGVSIAVNIPGLSDPIATDAFTVGGGSPIEPQIVIPWSTDTRAPFINTGRHFLRQFQFLYDAQQGFIGLKNQPNPCGEG